MAKRKPAWKPHLPPQPLVKEMDPRWALDFFAYEDPKHPVLLMAHVLGVSRAAVYKWLEEGEIPALRRYQLRDWIEGREE